MRHFLLLAGLCLAGLATADEKGKGTPIDLDGTRSATPGSWVKEAPANRMRFAQFRLPKVKDDRDDGEVVIFKGLGGSASANIERWKKQFTPPRGKSIDDVSKVSDVKIAGGEGKRLDVQGTYQFNPAPFNPRSKTTPRPNYRMVAIHLEGPRDVYHIRMVGPAKTIEHYLKGFDDWLQGYKK